MDQKSVPFLTDDHDHPSIVVESPDTRFIGMSNFSFFLRGARRRHPTKSFSDRSALIFYSL